MFAVKLDAAVADGTMIQSGDLRSMFEDAATYGVCISEDAILTVSSTSGWDHPADHSRLFAGERLDYVCHTASKRNPWIKIDLGEVKSVCGVRIENKTDDRRSGGLVMSLSEDGEA